MSRFWEMQDYCNANYTEVDIPRYRPCTFCGGRGLSSHPDSPEQEECGGCNGAGEVEITSALCRGD